MSKVQNKMHGKLKFRSCMEKLKFRSCMDMHITLKKNAGTNMIHTEDQTIRTIIVFVQVWTIPGATQCRDLAGHPSL